MYGLDNAVLPSLITTTVIDILFCKQYIWLLGTKDLKKLNVDSMFKINLR